MRKGVYIPGNEGDCEFCQNRDNNQMGFYCMAVEPEIVGCKCLTYQKERESGRKSNKK